VTGESKDAAAPQPDLWPNGEEKVLNKDSKTERDMANIDISSPIRLSQQAKDVISKLRQMKDAAEDWVK